MVLSLAVAGSLLLASAMLKVAQAQCNPLTTPCPSIPGFATSDYFVDFTQQSTLPPDWILANYENVSFGPNGAEFTFAKRFDSPYIWTSSYILFGHVDVVMQAAPGTGIISGSVLLSDDGDEIDWEFSGNNFGGSTGKVQTNYYGKGITGSYDRGTQPSVNSPQGEFHTYSVDWSPAHIIWSVDGTVVRTLLAQYADNNTHQFPQTPSRLHLGLWDAGDPDSSWGTVEWAGGYTNFSLAPFTMYVKSVRISNATPCSNYQYLGTSGTWQSIDCVNSTSSSPSSSDVAPSTSPSSISVATVPSSSSVTAVSHSTPSNTCPCSVQPISSTVLSTLATNTATPTGSLSDSTSLAPSASHCCNYDNCLRNLIDKRYITLASSLCSTLTMSPASQTVPSWLGGCKGNATRVASGCKCMMTAATTTSTIVTSAAANGAMRL